MAQKTADEAFPFPSYREFQEESYKEASKALFEDDKDVVVLNLPTGVGKSGICTGLADQARSAFLTTPQKSLRSQLENDEALQNYFATLRARADYTCAASGTDCSSCPINTSSGESCVQEPGCTYWREKSTAMRAETAVLTFAYLIVDGYIPTYGQGNEQISFQNRDLLVCDEVHELEDYVAGLFAGITLSQFSLPREIYDNMHQNVGTEDTRARDILPQMTQLLNRMETFLEENAAGTLHRHGDTYVLDQKEELPSNLSSKVDQCQRFLQRWNYALSELTEGRPWVVDVEDKKVKIQPIDVDRFLQNNVWNRAEKIVLSTATMPYMDDPEAWLERIGLGDKEAEVIQYPMPFEAENRPIETRTIIDKFSSGGFNENYREVVDTIELIASKHEGKKGLLHTASYARAKRLKESLGENAMLHQQGENAEDEIERWQESNADMFLSPSCVSGVDLTDDMCRWQVLCKVPYPNVGSNRVSFLLEERKDWKWYYETTALSLIQSVGRGVRSKNDHCTYYVLDRSWKDVMNKASVPEWFTEAQR